MNKQELIKHFEEMEYVSIHQMGKKAFIDMIEQLDEPQKITVPQFVADWIEKCKSEKRRLHESLTYTPCGVNGWISNPKNQETFARAWMDGYEIEKEKRYLVKMKGMDKEFTMLKLDKIRGSWYLGNDNEYSYTKTAHTHKELEEAGFGEVFNSPLFEVEEVEG